MDTPGERQGAVSTAFPPPTGVRFEAPTQGRSPAWIFQGLVGLLALVLVSAHMVTTSRAAFTMTTQNTANTFTAGTVDLVDDDLGGTLFNVPAMAPGQTVQNCIVVTYNGSLDPSPVKLYSGGFVDSGNFGDYLTLTVDEGTGGAFNDCTGFSEDDVGAEFSDTLTQFDALHTNYTNGFGDWDPSAPGQTKTYRLTVQLDPTTPDVEQGESVSTLTFTWEVQS